MTTDAQKRASAKYAKANVRQVVVKFYPADYELYDFVKSQDGVNAYMKRLVREDMERRRTEQANGDASL